MSRLGRAGSVMGIDVGYSPTRRSSAACRLDWHRDGAAAVIGWQVRRFRADAAERADAIGTVAGGRRLRAVALDGPLAPGMGPTPAYRCAERMLTRVIGRRIGKPGACNAPVGQRLNRATMACAEAVIATGLVDEARHPVALGPLAIVEAFPTSFLGLMLPDPGAVAARRADRSDVYYEHLAASGGLLELIRHLLPDARLQAPLAAVRDHDERAALVCALTALCVAGDAYAAVGDAAGWIILPPTMFIQDWALADLRLNATAERHGCLRSEAGPPVAIGLDLADDLPTSGNA